MVKVNSNSNPEIAQLYGRDLLVNFNVEEHTETDENGTRTSYDYEQVKVRQYATKAEIISAIIHNKYDADAEIALINNKISEPDNVEVQTEYEEYQARRELAKAVAEVI